MKSEYIYHVRLSDPVAGREDYYFGSLSAIYVVLGVEDIGCKVSRVWGYGITADRPYIGKRCSIYKERVYRKPKGAGSDR